MHSAASIISLN